MRTKNKASFILPSKPVPRTILTQSDSKKWKGCIYFSSYDSMGQILLLLKSISADHNGAFLNNPFFVFISKNKAEVENRMTCQLQSLFKRKQ